MPQSLDFVPVHFVFSTHHREPHLDPSWVENCYNEMGLALKRGGARLLSAGGVADHVHLLVSTGRITPLSELIRLAKFAAVSWIKTEKLVQNFNWQRGYAAFGVGIQGLIPLKQYIANQAAHHATVSFQDECRELLTRHDLEWDERYVWD